MMPLHLPYIAAVSVGVRVAQLMFDAYGFTYEF